MASNHVMSTKAPTAEPEITYSPALKHAKPKVRSVYCQGKKKKKIKTFEQKQIVVHGKGS